MDKIKFLIMCVFLLGIISLYPQKPELDTFSTGTNEIEIYNKTVEKKLYPNGVPMSKTILQEAYWVKNGKLTRQNIYLGDHKFLYQSWHENGTMENISFNTWNFGSMVGWNDKGQFKGFKVQGDSTNVIMELSDSTGLVEFIWEYNWVVPKQIEMTFSDPENGCYWVICRYDERSWAKNYFEIVFHEDGRLKEWGWYEQHKFEVYSSKKVYEFGTPPLLSNVSKEFKVGEWTRLLDGGEREITYHKIETTKD